MFECLNGHFFMIAMHVAFLPDHGHGHIMYVWYTTEKASLAERVNARGGTFLEAPVSGSKGQAAGVRLRET